MNFERGGPDLALLRRCAVACERAYERVSILSPYGAALVEWSDRRDEVLVAFRGSNSLRDWVTNLDYRILSTRAGGVHAGFWRSAVAIVDQVLRLDQRADKARLILCGHSKGGAEALVVAWLLAEAGWRADLVVTFGGPRVGDAVWRGSYLRALPSAATWRVVNSCDVVARVPGWWRGFRHVGTEVFLPAIGGVRVRPSLWLKGISDLAGVYREWSQGRVAPVFDHRVYRERVEKIS